MATAGVPGDARIWQCSAPRRPPLNGRRQLTGCSVNGCRYGSSGFGLCMRHRRAWERLSLTRWPGRRMPRRFGRSAAPSASLPFCDLWTENGTHLFCKAHETRWRQLDCPDAEEFIELCLLRGKARIDFRNLAPQLRIELQYAVQCRRDQETITLPPQVAGW